MRKKYVIDPELEVLGRSLYDNLVLNHFTLGEYGEDFVLKSSQDDSHTAHFDYKNRVARILVNLNSLEIEAETTENLRLAETKLIKICDKKGIPIVDLNKTNPLVSFLQN